MRNFNKIHNTNDDIVQVITNTSPNDSIIVCNYCSDSGDWTENLAIKLSEIWIQPKIAYHIMHNRNIGNVDFIRVSPTVIIANMIVLQKKENKSIINLGALRIAYSKVNDMAYYINATLHQPQYLDNIPNNDWSTIESILKDCLDVNIIVYTNKINTS